MASSNSNRNRINKMNVTLWVVQGLLCALFLMAGVSKLVMPIEAMTQDIAFPGWFLRFIGVAETLGAVGLILPTLLRIQPQLTPLAASGLVIIMIGATTLSLPMGVGAAVVPFVAGTLAAFVAYGRTRLASRPARQRRVAPRVEQTVQLDSRAAA